MDMHSRATVESASRATCGRRNKTETHRESKTDRQAEQQERQSKRERGGRGGEGENATRSERGFKERREQGSNIHAGARQFRVRIVGVIRVGYKFYFLHRA